MTTITINPNHWIKIATAAKRLGIKRQGIYYHVRQGNIEKLEIDGAQFVRATDIQSLTSRPQAKQRRTVEIITNACY